MIAEANKDDAKALHLMLLSKTKASNASIYYTDGSGINGNIGAAAYSCCDNSTARHLGLNTKYVVFGTELEAIHPALGSVAGNLRQNHHPQADLAAVPHNQCVIYSDSQASLKAISKPGQQSSQCLVHQILQDIDTIHSYQPDYLINLE
jgi:hypothetical protein